ncbi:hypothetical protein K456DRAFT_1290637 [Colletotrichum gloeosporioides 23]|nr:hypothetical protein K456DRAFT_1290637 [Colletotrichum gloeosporioides 23]
MLAAHRAHHYHCCQRTCAPREDRHPSIRRQPLFPAATSQGAWGEGFVQGRGITPMMAVTSTRPSSASINDGNHLHPKVSPFFSPPRGRQCGF